MKLSIKYNFKLSMWIISINKITLFNLIIRKISPNKSYSKLIYNYFILLKILRQFGLKKSIKNSKYY